MGTTTEGTCGRNVLASPKPEICAEEVRALIDRIDEAMTLATGVLCIVTETVNSVVGTIPKEPGQPGGATNSAYLPKGHCMVDGIIGALNEIRNQIDRL